MAHEEFPLLTEQAKHVLMSTMKDIDVSKPYWDRIFAAAVIREAARQAGPFTVGTGLKCEVVEVAALNCIADNLHALAPVPPTREEMDEVLRGLLSLVDYHPGSKCDAWAQTLQRGIAHYCKVQP